MNVLRPYQEVGAAWLATKRAALLADEMGLGKTVQAVVAAQRVGAKRVRVVCPATVVPVWLSEFAKWAPEIEIEVGSYDRLTRSGAGDAMFDVLIVDEAHCCKNPSAKRTKAVLGSGGAADRARRVWCLTGTPMPNNPSELWPILHRLAPECILQSKTGGKPMNFWSFTRRYCVVRNNGFGEVIVRGQRLQELAMHLHGFMLRRRKADVLKDLPPMAFNDLPLSSEVASKEIDRYLRHEGVHFDTAIREALAVRGADGLQGIAQEMASLRRVTAVAKAPALAAWADDWLGGTDRKLVLFAVHRDAIDLLSERLSIYRPCVVHGGVTPAMRESAVTDFQNDPDRRVFIGQVVAAGTGVTLTAASTLVFLEQSWTPADNMQAAMRIHRIGQTEPCAVYTTALEGSIDAAVSRALARKTSDLVQMGLADEPTFTV